MFFVYDCCDTAMACPQSTTLNVQCRVESESVDIPYVPLVFFSASIPSFMSADNVSNLTTLNDFRSSPLVIIVAGREAFLTRVVQDPRVAKNSMLMRLDRVTKQSCPAKRHIPR